MSYSTRTYILGADDILYRLASAKFSRMVDDPESRRRERFAGQRARMAEVIVEVRNRAPCAVVRVVASREEKLRNYVATADEFRINNLARRLTL